MDSFYGGKQGISFVIKERFKSIADMNIAFEDPVYDKVWYGEYCIIDTDNKNNKENGRVYRRTGTHAGTSDSAYAEYVGQIVGPAGGVPNGEIETLSKLESNFKGLKNNPGLVYYWGKENENSESSSYHQIETNKMPELARGSLLTPKEFITRVDYKSGRDYNITNAESGEIEYYNPNLKYEFYTFQSNEKDEQGNFPIATIGLGFEIPYPDFDIVEVEGTNPDGGYSITDLLADSPTDFYHQYKITVPSNIPGPSLREIETRNDSPNLNLEIYDIADTEFKDGKLIIKDNANYKSLPFNTSAKIEIGKLYYYNTGKVNEEIIGYTPVIDPKKNSQDNSIPALFYIKDINEIQNVSVGINRTLDTYGKLTIKWTEKDANKNQKTTQHNLSFLDDLKIVKGEEDNLFYLEPHYTDGYTGKNIPFALNKWGVWATQLTEGENGKLIPEGATPSSKITDISDPSFIKSAGNLGILLKENTDGTTTSSFYFWELTKDSSTGAWSGKWKKIKDVTETTNSINLDIDNFDLTDKNNHVKIKTTSAPTKSDSSGDFDASWYVWR